MFNYQITFGSSLFGLTLTIFTIFLIFYTFYKIPLEKFSVVMLSSILIYYPILYVGICFSIGIPIQIHDPNNLNDLYITILRYSFFSLFWFLGVLKGCSKSLIKNSGRSLSEIKPINISGSISYYAAFMILLLELFLNLKNSGGIGNSYLLGGNKFFFASSGLSEYIALSLAVSLIYLKNKKINFLDLFVFVVALINIILGLKAAASLLVIYLLIRFSNYIAFVNKLIFKKEIFFRLTFLATVLLFIFFINFANLFRCVARFGGYLGCRIQMFSISQASELLNTNISITRDLNYLGEGLSYPLSYIKSIIILAIPSKITNIPAVYNPALPYLKMIEKGFHVGGGGSLDSHLIFAFGNVIGLILSFIIIFYIGFCFSSNSIYFKIFKLRISSELITTSIALLSIRFFYYDPISVLIRTLPIGLLLFIILNSISKIIPKKEFNIKP